MNRLVPPALSERAARSNVGAEVVPSERLIATASRGAPTLDHVLAGLGAAYLVFGILNALRLPKPEGWIVAVVNLAIAALFLAGFAVVRGRSEGLAQKEGAIALAFIIANTNTLNTMRLFDRDLHVMLVGLALICFACFSASDGWFAVGIGGMLAEWVALRLWLGTQTETWVEQGFYVLATTSLALLVYASRRAGLARLGRSLVDLQQKTEGLGRISAAKSQFLATLSHELRTPLAAVVGYNSLLLQTTLDPKQRAYAVAANRSGEAILALLEGVLDLADIEAGRFTVTVTEVDLSQLCEEALQMVATAASAKGLDLAYDVQPAAEHVRLDATKLRQVLVNLLSNAVKFTSSGSVWLEAVVAGGDPPAPRLCITVSDTGPGIGASRGAGSAETPAQTTDGQKSGAGRGRGLGLAISKRMAEAMGGALTVGPAEPTGTLVTLTIPLSEIREPAPPVALGGQRVLLAGLGPRTSETIARWLLRSGATPIATSTRPVGHVDAVIYGAAAEPDVDALLAGRADLGRAATRVRVGDPSISTSRAPHVRSLLWPVCREDLLRTLSPVEHSSSEADSAQECFADLRVLVVDDDESNRQVVEAMLSSLGSTADVAADGWEAIRKLDQHVYDLILLDLRLPGASGFEVARMLRSREPDARKTALLVAHSADTLSGEAARCRAVGFDDYVAKPIDPGRLAALLRRARERAQA